MRNIIQKLRDLYRSRFRNVYIDECYCFLRCVFKYNLLYSLFGYYYNWFGIRKHIEFSEVYIFSGAHLFEDIYAAYSQSRKPKLVFSDISLKSFLNKIIPNQEIIFYDHRIIKYCAVINYYLNHPNVDVYAAHAMGEANIYVCSHFRVGNFYKCSAVAGYAWKLGDLKGNVLERFIEKYSRQRISMFESTEYSCYGIREFTERRFKHRASIECFSRAHKVIVLDISSWEIDYYNIDMENSAKNIIAWLFKKYGRTKCKDEVVFKRHPSHDYSGINDILKLKEIDKGVPVEFLINEDTELIYLASAASGKAKNIINMYYLIEFFDEKKKGLYLGKIRQELDLLNRNPVWAKLDDSDGIPFIDR